MLFRSHAENIDNDNANTNTNASTVMIDFLFIVLLLLDLSDLFQIAEYLRLKTFIICVCSFYAGLFYHNAILIFNRSNSRLDIALYNGRFICGQLKR